MSWMSQLYQTYENNKRLAGMSGQGTTLPVIAHKIVNAQIEIVIRDDGRFEGARELKKDDGRTLIPVTEVSEGRTIQIAPHPLSDMLSYVALDYPAYILDEKEKNKSMEKGKAYTQQLLEWKESSNSHPKVKAIYKYIAKGCMIKDLVASGIVVLDEHGMLSQNKVGGQPYEKAMVRFVVLDGSNGGQSPRTWEDSSLMEKYIQYYLNSQEGIKDICYLTGDYKTISVNHPKGIIASNYGAKLISANDTSNFVFRGRFLTSSEACAISYEASQKAHLALTWLIANQGVFVGVKDKRTYICWNPGGKKVPDLADPFSFEEDEAVCYTEPEYKRRLIAGLQGYAERLQNNDDIVIMGLDAATTGRLSITYFNELKASDFLKRLENWGSSCRWYFNFFKTDKTLGERVETPTVKQIVTYAFGTEQGGYIDVNDKVLKEQSQRIYYCMLDGQPLPKDLVQAICYKASSPSAYANRGNYERVLSTACALVCKYYNERKEGSVKMELDYNNQNRSYLFGRLLAIAERVEKSTYRNGESRIPNAIRLQTAYVNHPMRTWAVLEGVLIPYYQKLNPASAEFYKKQIEEIVNLLEEKEQDILNKSLEDYYLIGYYAQRRALRMNQIKKEDEKVKEENE